MAVLRRLRTLVWTILLVHAAAFLLVRGTRGGPFDEDRVMSPQVQAALEQRFGLHDSLLVQYGRSLLGLVQGDFGPSLRYRDTEVSTLIGDALPVSLALGGGALLLGLGLGIPTGLYAASRRRQWRGRGMTSLATVLLALPNFVLAALAIGLFSFSLAWLPPAGFGAWHHLLLPWLCLGLPLAAQVTLLVRARSVSVLEGGAVRNAIAQGLPMSKITRLVVLRASLTPVLAFLGPATAALLTGSLVIERIFALPGLGTFFVEAALSRDYTLALGVTVVYTALLGGCTLIADLLLARTDPRVEALS